jgi:hypothetical protein
MKKVILASAVIVLVALTSGAQLRYPSQIQSISGSGSGSITSGSSVDALTITSLTAGQITITGTGNTEFYDETGTNVVVGVSTNGIYGKGTVVTPITTFASATNTLTVSTNGAAYMFVASTDVAITNVIGSVAGYKAWASAYVSNSTASAITARYLATGTALGTGTTNALSIASGKIGRLLVECVGVSRTNYVTVSEQ